MDQSETVPRRTLGLVGAVGAVAPAMVRHARQPSSAAMTVIVAPVRRCQPRPRKETERKREIQRVERKEEREDREEEEERR